MLVFTLTVDINVATVLTVYGIETEYDHFFFCTSYRLQQYLPFTVLKPLSSHGVPVYALPGCNSTYRLRY